MLSQRSETVSPHKPRVVDRTSDSCWQQGDDVYPVYPVVMCGKKRKYTGMNSEYVYIRRNTLG